MDIDILLILQAFRNGAGAILAEFLSKMTFLGELNTVLVLLAVIYWCLDKDFVTYLLMGWSGNRLVNGVLKVTFCAYRPWIRDARVIPYGNMIETATGYSFPSGHTMNAATIYGGTAVRRDMPHLLRVILMLIVVLVAFSRMFMGVHTPQDVLVGAAAGMTVMYLTYRMMKYLRTHPEKDRLVVVTGVILAALTAFYAAFKSYPADYDAAGRLIVDGAKMANDTFKGVGWCSAFLIGWILEHRYAGFSTDIPMLDRITRGVIGLLGYYAVSLILVPLVKSWTGGPAGTLLSCFIQMFFISFLYPFFIHFVAKTDSAVRRPED